MCTYNSYTEEEMEQFYEEISMALNNASYYTVFCSDFNAKVGLKSDVSETTMGNFETSGRNEHGTVLLQFLLQKDNKRTGMAKS